MILLDGKKLSQQIKKEIKEEVDEIRNQGKNVPHLAAVLVGGDPASSFYVNSKIKSCNEVGFESTLIRRDSSISEEELLRIIKGLNDDPDIDGYIVQLPLPKHINEDKINWAIDPSKDVDGFHPTNFGLMAQGNPRFIPATPLGIMTMLDRYQIETSGKNCVVLGRSNIVGRPMSILMSSRMKRGNATVTIAHSRTENLEELTKKADILIAALGIPKFITKEMIKEDAVVIDVGINRIEDKSRKRGYRIVGDVDFDYVAPKCSYITPVPGGVGLMTVTSLLLNTLKSNKLRNPQ